MISHVHVTEPIQKSIQEHGSLTIIDKQEDTQENRADEVSQKLNFIF